MCPDYSFDELLKIVEMNDQLACDQDIGGCGKLNHKHHILSSRPHVFTVGKHFALAMFQFAVVFYFGVPCPVKQLFGKYLTLQSSLWITLCFVNRLLYSLS
jgi:hypothetical protein